MDLLSSTRERLFGQETDWVRVQPSGFGRLLLALAIIAVGFSLLDHVAAGRSQAGVSIASSYGSNPQRR
ncbi:hypothetical protein [Mesorhizobium sp. INR15]|uniref:hypothetical protein n=1 Tax=Mesorhizobium sp. INR15 TaxID=2654248 RepID=UPI0021565742|nr:hypothetical protein [Mesorhizobium sp. INR15]